MSRFYHNALPPTHPQRRQTEYPPPAPQPGNPRDESAFSEMMRKRRKVAQDKLDVAISRSIFPSPEARKQCLYFIPNLRIFKHLFLHTFVHLVSCCGSSVSRLVQYANTWVGWDSIQQLVRHSIIKGKLLGFWGETPCKSHGNLYDHKFDIDEDRSDLLSHILHCGKKPELYALCKKPAIEEDGHLIKESEQTLELLWKYIEESKEHEVLRRLRSYVYRVARKSACLPCAARIGKAFISDQRPLNEGGFGMVVRATLEGQAVAIKKITLRGSSPNNLTQRLEMFASEAILWKTFRHKNIVPFLGAISEDGPQIGLVSPFYKNGSVVDYLKKFDARNWPAMAKVLGKELAAGLEFIHSYEPPIIHGDIKGNNVLVDDGGHARLGDFGQSHASDSCRYLDSGRIGYAASPPQWKAPELMIAEPKATDKTDIYAFGCVLYEMVSGKIPFEGYSPSDVARLVTSGKRPDRPHSIARDDPLWRTIESCWKWPAKDRPSASQLFPSRA